MSLNKVEIWGLKLILARFKSKSPAGYALLTKVCVIAASIMGAYIILYNSNALPIQYATIEGKIDNIFIVLGASFTALGLGSASTTTSPDLLSEEAKKNVINDAIEKGTHVPIGPQDN